MYIDNKLLDNIRRAILNVQDKMLFDNTSFKPVNEVIKGNDYSIRTYMRLDGQVGMEVTHMKPVDYIKLEFKAKKTDVSFEELVRECTQEKP